MDLSNIKDGIMMHASEKLQGKKIVYPAWN